jgi:hypothetical protein
MARTVNEVTGVTGNQSLTDLDGRLIVVGPDGASAEGTSAADPQFTTHSTTAIGSGRKVVTTAGTRVALAASTAAKWVIITAETDNTGNITVGSAAGVIAAQGTREGTPLAAGDSITLDVDNLADVGLDSTVSGDGVTYTYGA